MNYSNSTTLLQLSEQNPFLLPNSKLPNLTSTPSKSILIIDLTQDEDTDQIYPTPSLEGPKEDFISKFLQRRDEIIKKIAQIYQQTEDEEKRVLELRRLIFTKPRLQEAIYVKNLLKNNDSNFNKQILQELTSDIQLSFHCLQHLRRFYVAQKSLLQAEKYIQTSRMIESTWQQIYKLSIYDPVLISQVSKLEWIFRSFEVLNHSRTDYSYPFLEYCEILKEGALASQGEKLIESKYFQKLEEETQRYKFLIGKVMFLLDQERNSGSAQKMNVEEVKKLLQELKDFGFGMKQEVENVEEILTKAFDLGEKFNELFKKKALVSANDLLVLLKEIHEFSVRLSGIEEYLTKFLDEQKEQIAGVLQETAQRILGENREIHMKFVRYAKERTIKNGTMIPEAESIWRNCGQQVQKITKYSEKLMQDLPTFNFEDFSRIRRQIREKGYEHIKGELWLAQMRLLGIYCESLIKPSNPITFEEICSFLPEIKDYVNGLPHRKRAPFDKQIDFLHRLLREINIWIGEERDKQEKIGKRNSDKVFYGFIDVTKEMAKPAEKQQQSENPSQLQIYESINGKRSRIDYLIREIDEYEEIEKKLKTHNEIHQSVLCSLEENINQKLQLERVKIEELDEKHLP